MTTVPTPRRRWAQLPRLAGSAGPGALLVLAGFAAVMISFTVLPWIYRTNSTFAEIGNRLSERGQFDNGWAWNYFVWLGWTLIGVLVVVGLVANLPTPHRLWFRIAGAAIAAVAVALTFTAIHLFNTPLVTYSTWVGLARSGFYTALAGFAAIGVGAALGRPRQPSGRVQQDASAPPDGA